MKLKMKPSISPLLIISVVIAAGALLYWSRQPVRPVPSAPISGLSSDPAKPTEIGLPAVDPRNGSANRNGSQIPTLNSAAGDSGLDGAATTSSRVVDDLISPQTSFNEKRSLAGKLLATGGLDQAIAELKQRAINSPGDPEIPATLGELDLGKIPSTQDPNEKGILALEADQYFNSALSIDPANWDAQFARASALSGWPAELNKGLEVVQQLSALIDQQETMPVQPQFALTYALLGDEYQKLGQPENAAQIWRLGTQKFPNNTELHKRMAHP